MRVPRCLHIPRDPDVIIGGVANPYLRRWWVIPRNRFFNIYLHHFMRSDDDRALHDHPWCNLSVLLTGSYLEHSPDGRAKLRKPWRPWALWRVTARLPRIASSCAVNTVSRDRAVRWVPRKSQFGPSS